MYPKIYLAIDNCVFYKRWTDPEEWTKRIKSLGLNYIEASADTELDPLYMGNDYLERWIDRVKNAEAKQGVKVATLYSGHGTYTTLGLTSNDESVRRNMIDKWFLPMVKTASELDAMLGFFAHAFKHSAIQNENSYEKYVNRLVESLSEINRYAEEIGCKSLGIEQMYTPHQYPWRLQDTIELIKRVTNESGYSFYFTEDVGHHHTKFIRPSREDIVNNPNFDFWLGSDSAYEIYRKKMEETWDELKADMDKHPHLFSTESDGDCFNTLSKIACYSPIIHLQQTDGHSSAHKPFTYEENQKGIIDPIRILQAIKKSYDSEELEGMPKRTEVIYLTLEIFSGTTSIMKNVMNQVEDSVSYWRQYIPEDGLTLDKLVI